MKKMIPKNIDNYTNITPDKLPSRTLTVQENDIISNFIKKYNKHNKKGVLISIFLGLSFALLCVYNNIFDFTALAGCSICFIIAFSISRKLLPSTVSCKYIQLGQLNGVWSLKSNNSYNNLYYFDVVFSDSLTRIKNVNCTRAEYIKAKKNDYILTFSFDGKTSYGCILTIDKR